MGLAVENGLGRTQFEKDSLSYIDGGEWVSYAVDRHTVAVYSNEIGESLSSHGFTERASRHADWSTWTLSGSTSFDDVLDVMGDTYFSPVLIDSRGNDVHVQPALLATVSFSQWEATVAQVLETLGSVDLVHVLSSPIGVGPRAQAYFFNNEVLADVKNIEVGFSAEEAEKDLMALLPVELSDEDKVGNIVVLFRLPLRNGFELFEKIAQFEITEGLVGLSPDFIMVGQTAMPKPFGTANDPDFASSWHLQLTSNNGLNVSPAWDVTYGYTAVIVAVLDSGVNTAHTDLNLTTGRNFANDVGATVYTPQNQYENHGTAVAGVVSGIANNSYGTTGVAPNVRVMPLRIGRDFQADGTYTSSYTWIINALNWAANNHARITNSSWSVPADSSLTAAFANTRNQGIIHFAATGNDYASTIAYPSSLSTVVAVGATNSSGARASFSNYGTGINLVAPGQGIITTDRLGTPGYSTGDFATVDGTSFASPAAAGAAALILSKNPERTPAQIQSTLESTARDLGTAGYDTVFGHGLVRPLNALNATPAGLWIQAGATDLGGGWKWQNPYGYIFDETAPTHYHPEHGFQTTSGTNPNSLWIFDFLSGEWFWTSIGPSPTYPNMQRGSDSRWFTYALGTTAPRWFWDHTLSTWVNF